MQLKPFEVSEFYIVEQRELKDNIELVRQLRTRMSGDLIKNSRQVVYEVV